MVGLLPGSEIEIYWGQCPRLPVRAERSAQGWRCRALDSFNPYVGPRAFEEKHEDLFFGRRERPRLLLSLLICERVVVSSSLPREPARPRLLNARLVPELRRRPSPPSGRPGGPPLPAGDQTGQCLCLQRDLQLAGGHRRPPCSRTPNSRQLPSPFPIRRWGSRLSQRPDPRSVRGDLHLPRSLGGTRGFFLQLRQALLDDPSSRWCLP